MNKLVRPPLPDELWSSTLARHSKLVGISGLVVTHTSLVGSRLSIGTALLPTQVKRVAATLNAGLSAEEIIARHTLLPYYEPFLGRNGAAARAQMLERGNVAFALGIAAMDGYPKWLKACPHCMNDDREAHGHAYWHRSHQPPGVLLCHRHKTPLCTTDAPANAATQISYFMLPDTCTMGAPFEIPADERDDLLWVAEQSHVLLDEPLPAALPLAITAIYRSHLLRTGHINSFDRLQQSNLISAFGKRLKGLLDMVECTVPNPIKRDNWLARMLGRSRNASPPLNHLLLLRFLGLTPREVIVPAVNGVEYRPKPPKARSPRWRSYRVTDEKALLKRQEWIDLMMSNPSGPLREKNDALYCWLWRNDRGWLRNHLRTSNGARNSDTAA